MMTTKFLRPISLLLLLPSLALADATDLRASTAQALLSMDALTAENCAESLQATMKSSLSLDPKKPGRARADAKEIVQQLWQGKLALRAKLASLEQGAPLPAACVNAARKFLNASRTLEDILGEQLTRLPSFDKKNPAPALIGNFPSVMLTPAAGGKLILRSGDVLLSRGNAYTSAGIARAADVPAQFSHLSILYIDRAGRKWIVQSTIEKGGHVLPFEQYQVDGKARAAVYRHPDAALAALAAKKIHDLIQAREAADRHIDYDFQMKQQEHSELFCTEVVSWAFEMASKQLGRNVAVPLHSSKITRRNRDFFEATGMVAKVAFLPADMEVDSRFELIAEWRDLAQTRKVRQYDAILDKQFEWMERLDYVHTKRVSTSFIKHLAYGLRHGPLSGLVDEILPDNMPKRTLEAVVSLFQVSGPMGKMLAKADTDFESKAGLPMTETFLKDALERYRQFDYKLYRQSLQDGSAQPRFHQHFRPRNE